MPSDPIRLDFQHRQLIVSPPDDPDNGTEFFHYLLKLPGQEPFVLYSIPAGESLDRLTGPDSSLGGRLSRGWLADSWNGDARPKVRQAVLAYFQRHPQAKGTEPAWKTLIRRKR